ncbi:MAG: methyltransferase domain-containing protein [bacterium]
MSGAQDSGFDARQRADAYPPGIGQHYWLLSRNRIVHAALRHAGAAAPVLDLGCGPGATVHYLRAHGIDCAGTDLSTYEPVVPELASVIQFGADPLTLPADERSRFRTLLLLDVLEHLAAPVELLRQVVGAYPNVAHLVLTVPARQELWSNYDEYYGHQRRYDRAALRALCRDAGLRVRDCRYVFHSLYVALALQRLLLRGDRALEFAPVRYRRLHQLIAGCLYADAQLVPGAWLGTSVLAVAETGR